jgi:hypothetical protein
MKKTIAAFSLLIIAAAPVSAQQWSLEAQAGRIRSALDPANTNFESVAIGARYDQLNSVFRLSGGVPTASNQPLWGSVVGSHRFAFRTGQFMAGLDLSGNAFLMHDRVERTREVSDVFNRRQVVPAPAQSGYAAALQAMPVVGFESGFVQAHVRAGISRYASEFADVQTNRNVSLAEAQLTFLPSASLAVMPVVRHFIADEGDFTFGGVTAAVGVDRFSAWASTGRWSNIEDQDPTWAAGATLRVNERLSLNASGRADAFDPLYGTPGQTAWSAGVAFKLGRINNGGLPVPAVFDAGNATIRLPVSESASPPRVAGDFTNWKPHNMRREGNAWIYTVSLQPGVYNFAFVDASGGWFVPPSYPGRKKDGMGGEVAVLVVR